MSLSVDVLRGAGHGRGQIDHRLARQHLINEYKRGRLSQDQICDAHPELLRAARHVGDPADHRCPVCGATVSWQLVGEDAPLRPRRGPIEESFMSLSPTSA